MLHEVLDALGHQIGVGRLGLRHPCVAGLDLGGHGLEVEEHRGDVDSRDPVHERVVGLRDDREAAALDALDEPHLPERLGAVEALGEDAPDQLAQLVVRARLGQSRVTNVVVEVEARVVHPERAAHLKARDRELLAIARNEREP